MLLEGVLNHDEAWATFELPLGSNADIIKHRMQDINERIIVVVALLCRLPRAYELVLMNDGFGHANYEAALFLLDSGMMRRETEGKHY